MPRLAWRLVSPIIMILFGPGPCPANQVEDFATVAISRWDQDSLSADGVSATRIRTVDLASD